MTANNAFFMQHVDEHEFSSDGPVTVWVNHSGKRLSIVIQKSTYWRILELAAKYKKEPGQYLDGLFGNRFKGGKKGV